MHYLILVICKLTAIIALSALEPYPIPKILVLLGLIALAAPSALVVLKSLSCPETRGIPKLRDKAYTVAE